MRIVHFGSNVARPVVGALPNMNICTSRSSSGRIFYNRSSLRLTVLEGRAPIRSLAVAAFPTSTTQTPTRPTNLPKQILLLRHGLSLGNEDETLFANLADWKIPLSEEGKLQARRAGGTMQRMIGDDPVMFYVSPYLRTKQTYDELQHHVTSDVLFTREEPRYVDYLYM